MTCGFAPSRWQGPKELQVEVTLKFEVEPARPHASAMHGGWACHWASNIHPTLGVWALARRVSVPRWASRVTVTVPICQPEWVRVTLRAAVGLPMGLPAKISVEKAFKNKRSYSR